VVWWAQTESVAPDLFILPNVELPLLHRVSFIPLAMAFFEGLAFASELVAALRG